MVIICIFLRLAGDSCAREGLRGPDVAYTAYPAMGTWRKGEGEGTHMSTSQIEEGRTELWVLTWWGKNEICAMMTACLSKMDWELANLSGFFNVIKSPSTFILTTN